MALYNTFFFKFVTGNFKKNYNISTLSNPAEKQSMLKKKKKKLRLIHAIIQPAPQKVQLLVM